VRRAVSSATALELTARVVVLEHLIVQRLDEEASEEAPADIASMLEYGAKEIFTQGEEDVDTDIRYKPEDIVRPARSRLFCPLRAPAQDSLLDRSEAMMPKQSSRDVNSQNVMAYARVVRLPSRHRPLSGSHGLQWEREKKDLGEVAAEEDTARIVEGRNFWASVLDEQKAREEQRRLDKEAKLGRGRRERKQLVWPRRLHLDGRPLISRTQMELHYSNGFESDQDSPKRQTAETPAALQDSDDDFSLDGGKDSDAEHDPDESMPSAPLEPEERDILRDANAQSKVKKRGRPKKHPQQLIPEVPAEYASAMVPLPRHMAAMMQKEYDRRYAWQHYDKASWPIAAEPASGSGQWQPHGSAASGLAAPGPREPELKRFKPTPTVSSTAQHVRGLRDVFLLRAN
jgi:hypothetical protein